MKKLFMQCIRCFKVQDEQNHKCENEVKQQVSIQINKEETQKVKINCSVTVAELDQDCWQNIQQNIQDDKLLRNQNTKNSIHSKVQLQSLSSEDLSNKNLEKNTNSKIPKLSTPNFRDLILIKKFSQFYLADSNSQNLFKSCDQIPAKQQSLENINKAEKAKIKTKQKKKKKCIIASEDKSKDV